MQRSLGALLSPPSLGQDVIRPYANSAKEPCVPLFNLFAFPSLIGSGCDQAYVNAAKEPCIPLPNWVRM